MINKRCKNCNIEFNTNQYNKVFCSMKCQRLSKLHKKSEYQKEHYQNNKSKRKEYTESNKERIAKVNAEWYAKNSKEVINKNKEREKQYLKTNINYLISKRLRTRLNCAIKNNQKVGSAVDDLGCTIKELKIYLEKQFQKDMTWDNYGKWHIDHIKPLANYDLTNRTILLELCNYKNLQPLWSKDNLSKSNKE